METDFEARSIWRRRLSRRTVLRGAGAFLGAAAVGVGAAGCGGSTVQPGSTQAGTAQPGTTGTSATPTVSPKRGGTLTLVSNAQFSDLNPQINSVVPNMFVYDHLFNYDYVNAKYELSLAQSLEVPDPLTIIFKIKPNAKHQNLPPVNGRQLTSEDVVASWQAFVANPRTGNKGLFTDFVDHYETPDPATLVVKMKQANAWAIGPHGFAGPLPTVIVPKELTVGDGLTKTAVGPGAYVLEKFDAASTASFTRRPDAWHEADRPYIDKVVYMVITDAAARAAALKSKQVDSLAARDKLEADDFKTYGPDMQIDKDLTFPAELYMRADAPDGLFHDARVREAVYNALDIKELIDTVDLGEGVYSGPVPPYLQAWSLSQDELKTYFPHDVAKAKQLLAAGGWDNNKEVDFKYPSGEKSALLCQILQKQLAAIGIKTKLVPEDPNTVWTPQTMTGKNFQLSGTMQLYRGVDPDIWLRIWTSQGIGGGNLCRWSDPEVDEIIGRQMREFDKNKQQTIIMDAQRMILKKFAPTINLYAPYVFTGRWSRYHAASTTGYVGLYGLYGWLDS